MNKEKDELNIKYRQYHWPMRKYSDFSIHNKFLDYKQILKPV